MTKWEKRIFIAETCGWTRCGYSESKGIAWGVNELANGCCDPLSLPDYLNDLNAMHEAEGVLTDKQWVRYSLFLREICRRGKPLWYMERPEGATAAQRADAFIEVIKRVRNL